ncbi:hypothetical protein [Amycolatopsis sp. NPDC051372]|uniref:hypothetical protein n=1 Tax=unclassified Amycolatopsis TaxID=2618356 RepID=UPI00342A0E91
MTNGIETETAPFAVGRKFAYLAREDDGVTVRTGVVAGECVDAAAVSHVPIVDAETPDPSSSKLVPVTDVTDVASGRNRHSAGNRPRSLPWRVFHVGRHRRA